MFAGFHRQDFHDKDGNLRDVINIRHLNSTMNKQLGVCIKHECDIGINLLKVRKKLIFFNRKLV